MIARALQLLVAVLADAGERPTFRLSPDANATLGVRLGRGDAEHLATRVDRSLGRMPVRSPLHAHSTFTDVWTTPSLIS